MNFWLNGAVYANFVLYILKWSICYSYRPFLCHARIYVFTPDGKLYRALGGVTGSVVAQRRRKSVINKESYAINLERTNANRSLCDTMSVILTKICKRITIHFGTADIKFT